MSLLHLQCLQYSLSLCLFVCMFIYLDISRKGFSSGLHVSWWIGGISVASQLEDQDFRSQVGSFLCGFSTFSFFVCVFSRYFDYRRSVCEHGCLSHVRLMSRASLVSHFLTIGFNLSLICNKE